MLKAIQPELQEGRSLKEATQQELQEERSLSIVVPSHHDRTFL